MIKTNVTQSIPFSEAFSLLIKEGGYVSKNGSIGKGGGDVLCFYENLLCTSRINTRGDLVGGRLDVEIDKTIHNENHVWEHFQVEPSPVNCIEYLKLPLPIPKGKSSQIEIYNSQLNNLCGIGLHKTLASLNSLSRDEEFGNMAKAYHLALQAITLSTVAARSEFRDAKADSFKQKEEVLHDLIEHCSNSGYALYPLETREHMPHPMVGFKLPYCEQLSFCVSNVSLVVVGESEKWDGKKTSTIPKIEKAIYLSGLIKMF